MRSPHRKHDRSSFFKYMTAEVAALVLKNRTLRWSSPVLFNDPFDVPRELILDLDYQDILQASAKCFAHLIEEPPEDTSRLSPKVRLVVETVKRGIPPEVKREMLESIETPEPLQAGSGQAVEELRRIWRALIPDLRILCLTERPTHAAMWCHYAGNYSGAVLEFRCLDETDSALLTAERVIYPTEKPAIYTAEGWAELVVLDQRSATEKMLYIATHTKAPDWRYENEWRVVIDFPTLFAEESALWVKTYTISASKVLIQVQPTADLPEELVSAFPSNKIFRQDNVELCSLGELVESMLRSKPTGEFIAKEGRDDHQSFHLRWEPPRDQSGNSLFMHSILHNLFREIRFIQVEGPCRIDINKFGMRSGVLGEVKVAWGQTSIAGREALVVASHDENRGEMVSVRFGEESTEESQAN
jgi:hypothetical protein